jgi:hypothetical protein
MNAFLFVVLWLLVVAGGLPTPTQRVLEGAFPWWHSRLFGLVSSFIEFLCGFGLVRLVLLMSGVGRIGPGKSVVLGAIGLFLLIEGVLRLAITPRLDGVAVPSLPVWIVARAVRSFFGTA